MTTAIFSILAGFALLAWSADKFIEGAASVSNHLGISQLLIGIVVIGFGTSAPEMLVSLMAAYNGNSGLALGNALGSNIANIGLILGSTAMISPIFVHSKIIQKEIPLLLGMSVLTYLLLLDREVSRTDAAILLCCLGGVVGWSVRSSLRNPVDYLQPQVEAELIQHSMSLKKSIFWLIFGLLLLIASSKILVDGAVTVAKFMGISDLVIGLTIVALGTSLPELAASVAAARKNEHDLALGNIIGSCLFNLLAVVGIAGVVAPITVDEAIIWRDWPVMFATMVLLFFMAYGGLGKGKISRVEGLILLILYIAYNIYLGVTVTVSV